MADMTGDKILTLQAFADNIGADIMWRYPKSERSEWKEGRKDCLR